MKNVGAPDVELSDNAVAVLGKRYLKKNEKGEPLEEPIDMYRRVAANIAEAEFAFADQRGLTAEEGRSLFEKSEADFLDLMLSRRFMPNSQTLMNAGRERQQLSACFVLPVEDSIDGIYDTLKHQAIIHKSGGGTAAAFSDALGRMISLAEKHGDSPIEIVHQLRGIQDGHPAGIGEKAVLSVPDGVAKVMAEHYLSAEGSSEVQPVLPIAGACHECGGELRHESGCVVCTTGGCGYSRCS